MNEKFKIKFISALEKCFKDENIDSKPELKRISMFKNEHLSVQLAYTYIDPELTRKNINKVQLDSPLKDYINISVVEEVNIPFPIYHNVTDENYLRKKPGLYPDLLRPLTYDHSIAYIYNNLSCLWLDIRPESNFGAGVYPITISFLDKDEVLASAKIDVEIIGADLPEQELVYTQWFHADCLSSYYDIPVYSEKHWQIIENYIKAAVEGGINMILTPVLTPPLDTMVGGERPTCQLVDIALNNGEYSFGFSKLDRWIDILLKYDVKYIEICHLFTQWGAAHAPKVMATVDGVYKKIFGWETDAHDTEYGEFLDEFLKALVAFLKEKGVDKMCWFHVSDEPQTEHLENYLKAKKRIQNVLEGYPILDALSNFEFYKTGAVMNPVPTNFHLEPFLEAKVPNLWTYYCCSSTTDVSNRFVAMPSARNRIMGVQMYKYDIFGFLHWGFNFYYNQFSDSVINPYQDPCGEYFVPAGDAFSVYPAVDGTALNTIHFLVFKHAIEDIRAFKLCESLYGKEYVMELIEGDLEEKIKFDVYPKDADYLLNLREKINNAVKAKL